MLTRLLLPILFSLLAGCAPMKTTQRTDPVDKNRVVYEDEIERLTPEVIAGRLRPSQVILMAHEKAGEVSGFRAPFLDEARFYEASLLGRVADGELTEAGFRYMRERKRSELLERLESQETEADYRSAAMWGIIGQGLGNASQAYQCRRPVTCYNSGLSVTCY